MSDIEQDYYKVECVCTKNWERENIYCVDIGLLVGGKSDYCVENVYEFHFGKGRLLGDLGAI